MDVHQGNTVYFMIHIIFVIVIKYINQTYLRDNFLMIRDGDGKDAEELASSLCRYYEARNREDMDRLPRVTRENVLILKYYSFENYFLDPKIMEKIGVIKSEDDFYEILLKKWNEYLYKLKSGQHLTEMIGHSLSNTTDIREHMEEIRICLRGHNLYDIFYGRFRKNETEILKSYIEEAPRDTFKDILDAKVFHDLECDADKMKDTVKGILGV